MAAYAALVSLMNTVNQIQIHPRISTYFGKEHMESLGEIVGVLQDFVERYNGSKEVEDLGSQIAAAAHAAEDAIESHVADQILPEKKSGEPVEFDLPSWQKALDDMYSIKEYVIGRLEDRRLITSLTAPPAASTRPVSAGKATMVGFDDYLIHLLDKLTGQPSHQLVMLPISGMGGVGKTTLARNAFDNLLVKQHFDFCAWATISQNYSAREILLEILSSKHHQEALNELGEIELGVKLHKFLFNRRYLIVLDDMWSTQVWDDIKFFFPENNNGSRIVVTTRLLSVALHFNSSYHTVDLLNEDKSWNLFCQESFEEEDCPTELEEVGKKICENCRGLPLSIVVIGGFLRKSSKSREYWEGIARDTHSILNSEGDGQCLNILSLSYNHLPAHLKPCFLYMGVFAEDARILVSRLIGFWVAEGFLRPKDDQSLEEVAEGYLKDLVDRNLVMAWRSNGKIRACYIHDLIRELCLSVAEKDNFFCVMKSGGTDPSRNGERRIVIDASMSNKEVSRALDSGSLVRSLICEGNRSSKFRLLRLLSTVEESPNRRTVEADLRCVNLRYLEYWFRNSSFENIHIPRQISFLWNLQTLRIMGSPFVKIIAPSEIWEMLQLRHIHVYDALYVPDPSRNDRVDHVMPNLHTLKYAVDFRLSEETCKRIPNIKRLSLIYKKSERHNYCSQNLGRLHKLESITLSFEDGSWRRMVHKMTFPTSLEKLTLQSHGGGLYWEDLEKIGSIPNLQVLKFKSGAIEGSVWNPVEGGFGRLKSLQIESCDDLRIWNADHFHFPVLEKLVVRDMGLLKEIPSGIGDIPTLRDISLYNCKPSCFLSAVKILAEQESLGNDDLKLEVGGFFEEDRLMRFREMVEEEGFTSNNLRIW